MRVLVEQIIANPYRDMDKYPTDETKVTALVESIKQTDFWDNLLARPEGNTYDGMEGDELVEYLSELDEAPSDMMVELGYGHHRLVAVKEAGITEINIPVKAIEDQIMLQIMANENKGDWATNMSVILETVRQVRNTLLIQANEFEDYEDYSDKFSFFSEKEHKAARKNQAVPYRIIKRFLGETWSESDIRGADATLEAVEEGIFTQEQIVKMPSVTAMNEFTMLAKAVREQDWPVYFKNRFVDNSATIIINEDGKQGATSAVIRKAKNRVKKGDLPVPYLLKQKLVPFDLGNQVKELMTADELTAEDILALDGLSDTEGLADIVGEVEEALAEKEKKAKDAAESEGGIPSSEVEDAISNASDEAGELVDPTLPLVEGDEVPTTLSGLADTFMQTASVFSAQTARLIGQAEKMDDAVQEKFGAVFEDAFVNLARVGLELYGKVDLNSLIDRAEKL